MDAAKQAPAANITSKVNIGGWIDSPEISPDGKSLYFMYAPLAIWEFQSKGKIKRGGPDRPGATTSGDKPEALVNTDIYEARLRGGKWVARAVTVINTPNNQEACPFVSFDGKRLYFGRNLIKGEEHVAAYVSTRTKGTWGKAKKTDVPIRATCNITLSADEREVFFDDDPARPGASSGKEILHATRGSGGSWGSPEKLPSLINSSDPSDRQQTPWLSEDGKRLYFNRFKENGSEGKFLVAYRNDGQSQFDRVEELQLAGLPTVRAVGTSLIGEPSLTRDEKEIYGQVWNETAVPEIWFAKKQADGSWGPMRPVN